MLDLEISDLRIRDIGTALSPDNFPSLTDLRIAQNLLTSLHGLIALPRLTALNADGNRLGSGNAPLFSPHPALHGTMIAAAGDNLAALSNSDPATDGRASTSALDSGNTAAIPNTAATREAADGVMEDVVLPALQVLQLGDNRLLSIDMLGVSRLTALRSLFLQNNLIVKVEGLAALSFLEELVCSANCGHVPVWPAALLATNGRLGTFGIIFGIKNHRWLSSESPEHTSTYRSVMNHRLVHDVIGCMSCSNDHVASDRCNETTRLVLVLYTAPVHQNAADCATGLLPASVVSCRSWTGTASSPWRLTASTDSQPCVSCAWKTMASAV